MASITYTFTDDNVGGSASNIFNGSNGSSANVTVAYYARRYCKSGTSKTYCNPTPGWVLISQLNSNITVNGPSVSMIIPDNSFGTACEPCSSAGDMICYDITKVCKLPDNTFPVPPVDLSGPSVTTSCGGPKACSVLTGVNGSIT